MEFDPETLMPLYRLTIGQAGQSYAIEIASNLGIYSGIIERAREMAARQGGAASAGELLDGQEYRPCNKNIKRESEAEIEHLEDGYTNFEAAEEEDRRETNDGYAEKVVAQLANSPQMKPLLKNRNAPCLKLGTLCGLPHTVKLASSSQQRIAGDRSAS